MQGFRGSTLTGSNRRPPPTIGGLEAVLAGTRRALAVDGMSQRTGQHRGGCASRARDRTTARRRRRSHAPTLPTSPCAARKVAGIRSTSPTGSRRPAIPVWTPPRRRMRARVIRSTERRCHGDGHLRGSGCHSRRSPARKRTWQGSRGRTLARRERAGHDRVVRGPARRLALRHLRRLPRRLGPPGTPVGTCGRGADGPGGRAARTASGHPAGGRDRVQAAGVEPIGQLGLVDAPARRRAS